jgi:glucan 1,3-beta-glucosidase
MIWDWGFTWKNIDVENAEIGIKLTGKGGIDGQGIGSLVVLDSHFKNVGTSLLVNRKGRFRPDLVLDNVKVEGSSKAVVGVEGGEVLLSGPKTVQSWAMGRRYTNIKDGKGVNATGNVIPAPKKPSALLGKDGAYFERSKPLYNNLASSRIVSVVSFGAANDGTGDQSKVINKALESTSTKGQILFFPAGIYSVKSTVNVPPGSIIIGDLWPQIQAVGPFFEQRARPQVMVKVGKKGDIGDVEISDMLFTVKGGTAGCILMEWNIHAKSQGSAAMWDTHFRVGGAVGSDLQAKDCPKLAENLNSRYVKMLYMFLVVLPKLTAYRCMAASLMLHLTSESSAYIENAWYWVADHDIDDGQQTQIDVYGGRGSLIESQGPTWITSASNEHSTLYNWNVVVGDFQNISQDPCFAYSSTLQLADDHVW